MYRSEVRTLHFSRCCFHSWYYTVVRGSVSESLCPCPLCTILRDCYRWWRTADGRPLINRTSAPRHTIVIRCSQSAEWNVFFIVLLFILLNMVHVYKRTRDSTFKYRCFSLDDQVLKTCDCVCVLQGGVAVQWWQNGSGSVTLQRVAGADWWRIFSTVIHHRDQATAPHPCPYKV